MTETKYARGPFHYSHWGEHSGDSSVLDADANEIAEVHGETPEQMRAHGELFAAAPDMYAALEAVEELFATIMPKVNWGKSFLNAEAIRRLNETPIAVRAALARAQGLRATGGLLRVPFDAG